MKIDNWETFYIAVRELRKVQRSYTKSGREEAKRLEAVIDECIREREKRRYNCKQEELFKS